MAAPTCLDCTCRGRDRLHHGFAWRQPPAASNSLLECVVLGRTLVEDIQAQIPESMPKLPGWDESQVSDADARGRHFPQLGRVAPR